MTPYRLVNGYVAEELDVSIIMVKNPVGQAENHMVSSGIRQFSMIC
jgi:hypothetical protein